jgi:hypothetical protein
MQILSGKLVKQCRTISCKSDHLKTPEYQKKISKGLYLQGKETQIQ